MHQDGRRPSNLESTSYRELRLLEEVEVTPELSQRHLARTLGVALGVANLLIRNLVHKGLHTRIQDRVEALGIRHNPCRRGQEGPPGTGLCGADAGPLRVEFGLSSDRLWEAAHLEP